MKTKFAKIPGFTFLWRLGFVRWRLILVCPQCGVCFMSPIWRLEFCGGS